MNFFAQEEHARRSSRRLVVLFVLAVIAVVVAIDVVVFLVGWGAQWHAAAPGETPVRSIDYTRIGLVSLGTLLLVGLASLYRSISLRSGGGAAVARSLGATPVPPDTTNFAWKRLRNVIEEIAIASGVPVPEIFVMEHEAGINAFAAGYGPSDAAVCVTQGCLDKLTRDEMQGVIAHEFSHVLNGDMRLNIRLIGLLFGILVVGILGRLLMFSGGRVGGGRSRGGGGSGAVYIAVIGIALLAIGYIGFFFGRLIQAAVARSRETLADASAVQFTRQSSGIAGALKKIAALSEGSELAAQQKQEVAHMLFGEGSNAMSWFATHPPLMQRIKTLDPAFDPDELAAIAKSWQEPRQQTPAQRTSGTDDDDTSLAGFTPLIVGAAAAAGAVGSKAPQRDPDATAHLDVDAVTAQVATPGTDDYQAASSLHRSISPAMQSAVRDPQQALAVVLALALTREAGPRQQQLETLRRQVDDGTVERVAELAKLTDTLHPKLRMPLASLAFPTLRQRPRPQLRKFIAHLQTLIEADGHISLDEYCLAKLVQVQVIDALDPSASFSRSRVKLSACVDEMRDLFALVAYYGNDDSQRAKQAFLHAVNEAMPGKTLMYARPDAWQKALDAALAKLDRLGPSGKELVVRGLTRAISDDGVVTLAESELLRVVCAALHCPLPPMLQAASSA